MNQEKYSSPAPKFLFCFRYLYCVIFSNLSFGINSISGCFTSKETYEKWIYLAGSLSWAFENKTHRSIPNQGDTKIKKLRETTHHSLIRCPHFMVARRWTNMPNASSVSTILILTTFWSAPNLVPLRVMILFSRKKLSRSSTSCFSQRSHANAAIQKHYFRKCKWIKKK